MKRAFRKALLCTLPLALTACFQTSTEIGKDLIDKTLLFDTYTVEFPIEDILLRRADDLSGFSDTRLAIGAIRDETFGLTTRSTAFTLVPALDTLDIGTDPRFVKFCVRFAADTISTAAPEQERIIQNFFIYSLTDTLSSVESGTNREIPHGTEIVSRGIPVYDGKDSLSFELTAAFGQRYINALKKFGPVLRDRTEGAEINKYSDFIKEVPGLYIESDIPQGIGGRINLFELSVLSVSNNYYYRNNNVATLTVNAGYNGVRKDTTFLFIPGEPTFYNEAEYLDNNQKFYQYAFNRTGHEAPEDEAKDKILIEGGGGLKPVIPAAQLREKVVAAITERKGDPKKTVVNKASIILPFEMPDVPEDEALFLLDLFPSLISPTIRSTDSDGTISFGGLTDASASSENQGDLDRSNLVYAPDITYHMQQILARTDLDTKDDADIWFLTVHSETVANANGNAEQEAYYQQMMYAMYYNNLYGGGYGGYGGYGYGYGSYGYGGYGGYGGYSNYYNMYMMASMLSSMNQTTYSTTQELDKDRYYRAILNGPDVTVRNPESCPILLPGALRVPTFRVTFSVPKASE
ncbi:MAG: hypothetical protein IK098_06675 [Bacteroidales bacterium]|nr:hypothetical protein [Bacteroidales bacterium]